MSQSKTQGGARRRRLVIRCLVVALAPVLVLAAEPTRVLVVTGGHEFDPQFFQLFEGYADIVYTRVAHPEAFGELRPERVERYDVIVLYDLYQGRPTGEEARKSFRSLLAEGKGLVVLHHALASCGDWPEFQKIVGGKYILRPEKGAAGQVTRPASTYHHDVAFRVEIADPAHPITRGMADFDLTDETYGGYVVEPDVHQLLRTSHPKSGRVIGWCKKYLRSRVVFLQPGHGPPAYGHPSYRRLVANSIRWADRRLAEDRAPKPDWRRLFNGRDLSGWKATGAGRWEVRDGVLVGVQGRGSRGGDLLSEAEFGDFDLQVTYRVTWPANTGVWFRYRSAGQAYQADILEWTNPRCWSGTLYCPGKMFIAMNTDASVVRRRGWNTMRIRARGDRLTVDLNGCRVAAARDKSSARGRVGFQVHAGAPFAKMQIEVLDVRIAPLAKESPEDSILASARSRIERHRKGPLTVRVLDKTGQPVTGADVTVKQLHHEFLFGCNVFLHGRVGNPGAERTYRTKFAALFNYATLPFYWRGYEPASGRPEHADRERVAEWCRKQGITAKGHPLVWNHPASVPRWLPESPDEVESLSLARVADCVQRFKGKVDIWDVVNEATDPYRFETNAIARAMRAAGRVEWTARSFQAARRASRTAVLLINDYRTDEKYAELIAKLVDADGKPLYDAIGIQSHMHGGVWKSRKTWEVCERFARFGAPLHFTETTIVSGRRESPRRWGATVAELEEVQARDVAQFYTTLFSHPAVEAITWWDFADHRAWQGAPAGFLRKDMSAKPAYHRLLRLVRDDWWSEETLRTGKNGTVRLRAFYGTFEIRVRHGGHQRSVRAEHARKRGGLEIRVQLP